MISSVVGVSPSSGSRSLTILTSSVANSSFPFPQTQMLLFISKTEDLPFSSGNKGWRHYGRKSIGVFVVGSIHWCIMRHTSRDLFEYVIDAIDLVSNTYRQLQCPDYNFGQTRLDNLNVGTVDNHLSLLWCSQEMAENWHLGAGGIWES
ncbi:hypothetical protein LINPERHAP1_LOCUS40166 [Linum perenne]